MSASRAPATPRSLRRLLEPESIAVVGASDDRDKAGGRPLWYMRESGYRGRVYPINPSRDEVQGLRCYPDLSSLPETPDLCVIAVPAAAVAGAVASAAAAGAGAAVVFASGYAEVGEEGRERQRRLVEIAERAGMLLAGPNCLGLTNGATGMAASFTTALERRPLIPGGRVGFITQSGAIGAFILALAQDMGMGFSCFVTTGNEAMLGFGDYATHLLADPATTVVAGYTEGLGREELLEVSAAAEAAAKPVVLMKVGGSAAGALASAAHTGKMAGADAVYDAAFRQLRMVRAESVDELLDYSLALGQPRRPAGRGIGVVSTSGGAAILIADWCDRLRLPLAPFEPATSARLKEVLPWFGSSRNPVDTTGRPLWDAGMMEAAVAAVAADPGVATILVHVGLAPGPARRIADEIGVAQAGTTKPILVCWLPEADDAAQQSLRDAMIPLYVEPVRMVRAAAALAGWSGAAARPPLAATPAPAPPPGDVVTEAAAKQWLAGFGVPAPRERVAATAAEAAEIAAELGFPVCLKLLSPQVLHRSDIGAVRVGLSTAAEVEEAFAAITGAADRAHPGHRREGMLVAEMAPAGVELLVSGFRDRVLGPCVMCAAGGVLAEVLADTAIRLAPVDEGEARRMLAELRAAPLLAGVRGAPPADAGAAAAAIAAVSRAIAASPSEVDAIEVNPLLCLPSGRGVVALDALVTRRWG